MTLLKALSRHWLVRSLKTESSLSRDFAILSAIIILLVLMISVWLTWEAFETQGQQVQKRVENEMARIDHTLNKSIDNAAYVLESMANQIILLEPEDHASIARLMKSFDHRPDIYGLFAWVSPDEHIKVASNQGVVEEPVANVADRDYQQAARAHPWKVHIGEPIQGRTSKKWVLPMSIGLTDDTGRYVGTLMVSLDIKGMRSYIERDMSMAGLNYAVYSPGYTLLADNHTRLEEDESVPEDIIDADVEALRSLPPPDRFTSIALPERVSWFSFIMPSAYHDYFIVAHYARSETMREIIILLVPRLLQIAVTALFLIGILWVLRNRIIKPVVRLTRAAARLGRGRLDSRISHDGPIEIVQLSRQLDKIHDYIEERKRIEDEMRRKTLDMKKAKDLAELADRSKSEFLACMSHELRTPLSAIIGFTDVMQHGYYGKIENEKYERYIDDIKNSGEHLLEIINDLLDLSRLEAGVMVLQERATDPEEIVHRSARLLADRASDLHIEVIQNVPDNLPQINVDPLRIKQVMINLLANAIKFTPRGGTITIEVTYSPKASMPMSFHISDTGKGMNPEQIPIALSRFGQIDRSRSQEGVGLGLPLSTELMALHQGTLEIESEVGKGTRVSFRFPAARIIVDASHDDHADHDDEDGDDEMPPQGSIRNA